MLYKHAEKTNKKCRLMVSQPRRIAALALMNRLRPDIGNKVGMRMGHDTRDETSETTLWFVTTGYLVRYLAHHPEAFNNHTHLIVDEVHERSIDGDLLCYMCRNLLSTHPHIRIILMSATIHTTLYKEYFRNYNELEETDKYYKPGKQSNEIECLSVGVKRFTVNVSYANDILNTSGVVAGNVRALIDICERGTGGSGGKKGGPRGKGNNGGYDDMDIKIPLSLFGTQCKVAVNIISSNRHSYLGKSVLLFVSGYLAIEDISELITTQQSQDRDVNYKVIPLHSELSDDQQELVFEAVERDTIKIIIATNIAESSITLPDLDTVLCFGTNKVLKYDHIAHTTRLVEAWISKDSGTQRAGRTGRVREGKIYRLYTENLYKRFNDHGISEFQRAPVQEVILSLRVMLENSKDFSGVFPILEDLPEPPELSNVEKSMNYLFDGNYI